MQDKISCNFNFIGIGDDGVFIEAIIVSIIIGFVRGGRLKKLRAANRKTIWLLAFGILIQYILIFLNSIDDTGSISSVLSYAKQAQVISYILILIGVITNFKTKSLWMVLVGILMNLFVIGVNGWKKPVLLEGLELTSNASLYEIIEAGKAALYTPITDSTKYPILGDIIIFAKPYPISRMVSLGDLIISFGIFTLIQEIMLRANSSRGYGL